MSDHTHGDGPQQDPRGQGQRPGPDDAQHRQQPGGEYPGSEGAQPYGGRPGGDAFGESWREQEFGHGQQRYYGDLGRGPQQPYDAGPGYGGPQGYEGPQSTPVEHGSPQSGPIGPLRHGSSGRRTALLAAAAVAAVAVLGGGGYAIYRGTQSDTTATNPAAPTQPTAVTTTQPSSTSGSSQAPSSGSSPGPIAGRGLSPAVPGWQVVQGQDKDHGGLYDVPPAGSFQGPGVGKSHPVWSLSSPTDTVYRGFGDDIKGGDALVIGRQPASYREGFCAGDENQDRAFLVWSTSGDRDPAEVGPDTADRWAKVMSTKKDKTSHESYAAPATKQVMVNGGKTPAVQSRTTIPNTEQDPKKCTAPKVELVVTSFAAKNGTATIVAVRDLGVPDALDDATLNKIIGSARVAP
ncbi:hypothetical protein PZ938_04955 [Luteipulveratus sp. YIM 133132]|uniref:hypothetical protein n=1 Tax=Luteipulveratus flavus TaxID=3031728 RepID=UPI0023B00FD6|nr:hypothetical protein [Luteipulveratus sp. YIM 133132]MDE9364947.1 hypothetical protein [Luteipulveratus sp. YIM 133132]